MQLARDAWVHNTDSSGTHTTIRFSPGEPRFHISLVSYRVDGRVLVTDCFQVPFVGAQHSHIDTIPQDIENTIVRLDLHNNQKRSSKTWVQSFLPQSPKQTRSNFRSRNIPQRIINLCGNGLKGLALSLSPVKCFIQICRWSARNILWSIFTVRQNLSLTKVQPANVRGRSPTHTQ